MQNSFWESRRSRRFQQFDEVSAQILAIVHKYGESAPQNFPFRRKAGDSGEKRQNVKTIPLRFSAAFQRDFTKRTH
jgi:hypothetical protein